MAELAQLITSIATLLGVGLSVFLALHGLKKIDKVQAQTNGMLKHVEVIATKVGYAAGKEDARVEGEVKAAELVASDAAKNA